MKLELLSRQIAEQLHGVAAFDQSDAFGGEPLQFDGSHLRSILLALAPLLRFFVVVEFALDAAPGAMEEIDGRPEEIFEVGFKPCVAQARHERIKDVGDRACDGLGVGKRPWVRLVVKGAMAIELKLAEKMIGR